MYPELTQRQNELLDRVKDFLAQYGYPPTVRELADLSGQTSTAGVHKILHVLERKGFLRREKGKSRSLELLVSDTGKRGKTRSLPVLGQIAAGAPDLAVEQFDDKIELDEDWLGQTDSFILRVKGHSMIDADIRDGDMIVVEQKSTCMNGEIVIALLDGEATVKRFFKEKNRIRLQPENPTMQPIYVDMDDPDFCVIGKVSALLRKY